MGKNISGSEVLDFVIEKCTETLKKQGIAPSHAHRAALAVSDGISIEFGGQIVYFKKGYTENLEERNLAILADYESGLMTVGEIASKYGISMQSTYKILRNAKK